MEYIVGAFRLVCELFHKTILSMAATLQLPKKNI
jgi:hypothetical protein